MAKNAHVKKVIDTIEVPVEVVKTPPSTKSMLIDEYRKLGKEMTVLRESHLKDIEALIVQYKKDKAAIKAKREELLTQIRKPKAEVTTEVEPSEATTVAA